MIQVRKLLPILIAGIGLAASTGLAIGQNPAIQIGYIPADMSGPVQVKLDIWAGWCGGDAFCVLFDGGSGIVTADGADATAVMAAVDAAMSSTACSGTVIFEPPTVVVGAMPGEVRHEYRVRLHPSGEEPHLVSSSVRFDRGGMSLSLRSPCGSDLPSEFTGPYYVTIHGAPQTTGHFVVWGQGKTPVRVGVDPSAGTQSIADAVLTEALAMGIHATPFGMSTVGFNVPRFDQDVSGLEYVGMEDASSIAIEIGNRMDIWVPTLPSTWGSMKAIYR